VIAIVTLLTALPFGFFFRSRMAAFVAYIAVFAGAFTFQGVYLMLAAVDRQKDAAFQVGDFPYSHGVVTGLIYAAGFGLVLIGHRLGQARRGRARRGRASASRAAEFSRSS